MSETKRKVRTDIVLFIVMQAIIWTDTKVMYVILLIMLIFLQVAYYYDPDIGNFYYGHGHPMKPHRVRMAHCLITRYGIYRHMEVRAYNSSYAGLCETIRTGLHVTTWSCWARSAPLNMQLLHTMVHSLGADTVFRNAHKAPCMRL